MRFDGAKFGYSDQGWPYVDAQGNYARTEYPQRASPGDLFFTVQTIGGKSIAVFETRKLLPERRAQIAAGRPDWLHALLYAEPSPHQMPPVATIFVEIGTGDDVAREACVFAAAIVFYGQFKFMPAAFFVQLWGHGTYEATPEFDADRESWCGDVIVQSLLDDD